MNEEESTQEEENVSEEEETTEKEKSEEPCYKVPEHMKPLFECCKDFDEGKIKSDDFFAKALIKTGEFMQNVKKKQKVRTSK